MFLDWDFVMNLYDPCVWNKMVDSKQMLIMFHIDDLLMSKNIHTSSQYSQRN